MEDLVMNQIDSLIDLPIDHRRAAPSSFEYGQVPVEIPAEVARTLRDAAQQQNATIESVYLAAWGVLCCRYGNTSDVLIGLSADRICVPIHCLPDSTFPQLLATVSLVQNEESSCNVYFDWNDA